MATLKEHVYFIQNIINKGPVSDDSRYSNRFIAHGLKQARALLLKRKLDKYRTLSPQNYQTICVPLELSTYHDCSCIPDVFDCKILKSTCELPKEINSRSGSTLQAKLADGKVIPYTSISSNDLSEYSLTNKEPKIGWLIESNHAIVLNDKDKKVIMIKGIWEDPETLDGFCGCNESDASPEGTCHDSDNDQFPIDSELVFPMYEMMLQLIGISYRYPEDKANNATSTEVVNDKEE